MKLLEKFVIFCNEQKKIITVRISSFVKFSWSTLKEKILRLLVWLSISFIQGKLNFGISSFITLAYNQWDLSLLANDSMFWLRKMQQDYVHVIEYYQKI